MKLIKNILLLSIISMLWACEKDELRAVATDGKPATLNASATTVVLTKAAASNTAITFNITPPDFGVAAAIINTLQLDKKGNGFAQPKEVILPAKAESKAYTVIDFNALLLSMGLPTGANSVIEARIKSQLSEATPPVYSEPISLTVNPYPLISFVYVPGDYQGWNPSTADSLMSATSNGIFEGIINFEAKPGATYEFKITPAKNWNAAYGSAGGGTVSNTGGNLTVPGPGKYKLTLNLNDMTFTAVPYSWGVIGSATAGGWSSDTDMTYNNGTGTWSLTTALIPGEIKFRLNDAWDVNLGGSGGTLANGGANISIAAAGTYRIDMNVTANTYTITKL